MNLLIVYLNTERVGSLAQDDSGLLQFTYDAAWLANPEAHPLSYSLPLRAEVFVGRQARAFFAGILPEEEPRRKIAGILGVSERNDFAILTEIGGECAGAVSLLPANGAPAAPECADSRKLTEVEIGQIVAELPRRPLMVGEKGLRLSLAGAQDKLPVIVHGTGYRYPRIY